MTTEITVVKCFEECADITEHKDDYKKFYDRFGKFLKLAIHENATRKDYRVGAVQLFEAW